MTDSVRRYSRFVNSTSSMPVTLTKFVMSVSVTVRPTVWKRKPGTKSSKWKPTPASRDSSCAMGVLRVGHRSLRRAWIVRQRATASCGRDEQEQHAGDDQKQARDLAPRHGLREQPPRNRHREDDFGEPERPDIGRRREREAEEPELRRD